MFSVIIPVYNKEHCIQRTIRSVLAQTFQDFEIIIVDDGSIDKSLSVINSILDSRIIVYHKANEGVSIARNYGIEKANREFVCFLDADDEWEPNFLESMYHAIMSFPKNSFFSCPYMTDDGEQKKSYIIKNETDDFFIIDDYCRTFLENRHAPCCVGSVCVRKSFVVKCGMFPKGIKKGEDHDLWMRLACREKLVYTIRSRMIYHLDSENNSRGSYGSYKDSFPYWKWYDYPYPVKRSLYKLTTYFLLANATHAIKKGKFLSAITMIRKIRLF